MIKRLKPMLILAGVALVLGILLWVLVAFVLPKEEAEEEKSNETVLIQADLSEADRIEVKNTFDAYTLVKKAIGSYYIEGKADLALAQENVKYLLENLTNFSGNQLLLDADPTEEQMTAYGLKDPAGVITIANDEETYTISLGTTSPSGKYYCRLDGDSHVYLVGATVPDIVLLSRYQFYTGTCLNYSAEANNEDLTDIYIGGSGRETPIRMKQQVLGEDEVGTSFVLTEPFHHSASNASYNALSDLMTACTSATIVGDDVSPAALAEHGLDQPVYILEFVQGGKTYTVHFGKTTDSGYQYCYETSGDFIYYVEAETVKDALGGALKTYCESMIYTNSVYELKSIKVEGFGKAYHLNVGEQNEAGDFNVTINNKKVDSELFSDFYSHVLTITIKDIGEKKGNDCIATVTLTLKDGTVDVMKFYKITESDCFYELNGTGRFWVSTMNVEKIVDNAQKLYDGEVINLEW